MQLLTIIDWFDEAILMDTKSCSISKEFKLEFLMLISGYINWPEKVLERIRKDLGDLRHWIVKKRGKRSEFRSLTERINSLDEETGESWILQVDANEIGNEARYANHADLPNAILVKRCANNCRNCFKYMTAISTGMAPAGSLCDKQHPHLVALREIRSGDEITINYGASYWDKQTRGLDTGLVGHFVTEPFADCIYYNGVVEDFQCSPFPGGFLIPPAGNKKRKRNEDIVQVRQVNRDHPAFPGFGLFAKRKFKKSDIICIYAGIVDMSPFSGRHTSKYAVDLSSDVAMGPFGFHYDPYTLDCKKRQLGLPFISDYTDISIPCDIDDILENLDVIGDLGSSLSRKICKALFLVGDDRDLVRDKLRLIAPEQEHASRKDADAWKKIVEKYFQNPLDPLSPSKRVKLSNGSRKPHSLIGVEKQEDDNEGDRPELIVLLEND